MVTAERPAKSKPRRAPMNFITPEEGRAILDQQARELLGMSGEEFAARWAERSIPDPDRPAVISVAMLLPLAR